MRALDFTAKVRQKRDRRVGTMGKQHFGCFLSLRSIQALLRDPSGLANAIDRLAKFAEHLRVGKSGLEKRRDVVQGGGRALQFDFDLILKSAICVCEIAYVNGHLMTCLQPRLAAIRTVAPEGRNCATY